MKLHRSLRATLTQLQQVLSELSDTEYERTLPILSQASLGQHTRHIIEFFQVLVTGYNEGMINYDKRQRNHLLETNRSIALRELSEIADQLSLADKEVLLTGRYSHETSEEITVRSTFHREILYNLEHAVHHMAMMKVGIRHTTNVTVAADFGVAPATIEYKKSIL